MEIGKMVLMPVMLLCAVNMVSAAGFEYNETPMLMAVAEHAKCRVDFTNGLIDSIVEGVPEASYLTDYQDTLNDDMDELYDLAQRGDRGAFKDYMYGTLQEDFVDTKEAIREARGNFNDWNVSRETKLQLWDDYVALNETYATCNYNTMKGIAEEKLNHMDAILEYGSQRSDELEGKGLDMTEVDRIISDARTVIVEPYESAVDSAETAKEVREAIGDYCLGNGCADGTNYHFFAKVEIAKLNSIVDYLEEDAVEAGLGDEIEEAQGYIDSADGGVQRTGYEQYAEGVGEEIWENIKLASSTIKDIFSQLRGA